MCKCVYFYEYVYVYVYFWLQAGPVWRVKLESKHSNGVNRSPVSQVLRIWKKKKQKKRFFDE